MKQSSFAPMGGILFEYKYPHITLKYPQYFLMMTNPIHAWPLALPESTITAYNSKTRRNRSGSKMAIPPPSPPDEATIRRLNELAAAKPFCSLYKVRKYDLL
jgi:hypothetical protein